MKSLLFTLFCLTQLAWMPAEEAKTSFTAEGMFLVKADDGTLAKEEVSMTFDMANKTTKLTVGKEEIDVKKVWVKKVRNLTTVFMAYETSEEGTYRILKGSYLKGSNLGTYSGDIFEIKKQDDTTNLMSFAHHHDGDHADEHEGCDCEEKGACGCEDEDKKSDDSKEEKSCEKCKDKDHEHKDCEKCKTDKDHKHKGCDGEKCCGSDKCKADKDHAHKGCKSGKCKSDKGCKSAKGCKGHKAKMAWFMKNFNHVGVFYFSKKSEK